MKFNVLLLLSLLSGLVAARSENDSFNVDLHYGTTKTLSSEASRQLYTQAVELLRSSNFNSVAHAELLRTPIVRVQTDYRKTVAGHFLVVSFDSPRKFVTAGGEIGVLEIVIGLNGRQYADSLFTVDEMGRVVLHSKYNGGEAIKVLKLVRQITEQ